MQIGRTSFPAWKVFQSCKLVVRMCTKSIRARTYLGGNENLVTLHKTVLESPLETLSALRLVTVVAGTIELPVTVLDGLVDGVGGLLGVELPGTHTDDGHLLAGGVESDVGSSDHRE